MARRSFSTAARRLDQLSFEAPAESLPGEMIPAGQQLEALVEDEAARHKALEFARTVTMKEPRIPGANFRDRYMDIINQVVGLVMQDGKKARAQRVSSKRLDGELKANPGSM